ncbi:hypothetical protein [Stutzerimonas kunmingensis]|uniref:hypothetical protein n=1 Tax=Stutzerimonas kunmingensis TaxID=1211807 RepID=UPI0028ACC802|nr:hypothetical protein [Stutzerimonas kunmingensis]
MSSYSVEAPKCCRCFIRKIDERAFPQCYGLCPACLEEVSLSESELEKFRRQHAAALRHQAEIRANFSGTEPYRKPTAEEEELRRQRVRANLPGAQYRDNSYGSHAPGHLAKPK